MNAGRLGSAITLTIALAIGAAGSAKAARPVDRPVGGPGDAALSGTDYPLGTDRYRSFRVDAGERLAWSTVTQTVSAGKRSGVSILIIETVRTSAAGDTTLGSIVVRADDLSLLHYRVRGPSDSLSVSSDGRTVTGWVSLSGEPERRIDVPLDRPVLPADGPHPWLLSALPLRIGYSIELSRLDPWSGEMVTYEASVLGEATLIGAEGNVDCWVVDGGEHGPPGYRAHHWVDKQSRRVIRSALRGARTAPEYWTEWGPDPSPAPDSPTGQDR